MPARIADLLRRMVQSLWLVPSLLVAAAVALSVALPRLDAGPLADVEERVPFIFGGQAEAARAVLSTIAGALITVVSLVFSITFVALSQVSMQFTPRLLRNFMDDRINQVVLGSFIGAFTYSLLTLRQVRSPEEGAAFVPALAVTAAIALAMYCMALLIYFFHHISEKLQVSTIMQEIHDELLRAIEHLYPEKIGDAAETEECHALPDGRAFEVRSRRAGFLRALDHSALDAAAGRLGGTFHIVPCIGAYVPREQALIRVWGSKPLSDEDIAELRTAFVFGSERTLHQDALFGIRQLADIGVKALSPGINDSTTAEHASSHLGDAVGTVAERVLPSKWRRVGEALLFVERPEFEHFVAEAFAQIRHEARGDPHVLGYLLDVLAQVRRRTHSASRVEAVCRQVRQVLAEIEAGSLAAEAEQDLRRRAAKVLEP